MQCNHADLQMPSNPSFIRSYVVRDVYFWNNMCKWLPIDSAPPKMKL
jgi:hypothetical protein